ncbi:MAG: hypothetical protein QOH88_1404 [Verrucomicrobiota bacterium]|jgi:hypothetical protein
MRFLAVLTTSLISLHAVAHAAEKKPPLEAYVQRLGTIVNGLVDAEITKHPELLNPAGFAVKLRYHVGRDGRVQAVEIISANPDRFAADRLASLIRRTVFPPYPKAVLQQGIHSIAGDLDWKWLPDKQKNGPPQAFIRVAIHSEPHSCVLAIVAIDGKSLPSPIKQASFSPGRHQLSIRVWTGDDQNRVVHADAPLEQSFKPHHYWLDGEMSKSGLFKLLVEDEDERPPNIKHHPQTK